MASETKITRIRTHQSLFVEGWGELKNSVPGPGKTLPVGTQFKRTPEGVEVRAPGKLSFLVPWANIISCEFTDVDSAPKKVTTAENNKSQAV